LKVIQNFSFARLAKALPLQASRRKTTIFSDNWVRSPQKEWLSLRRSQRGVGHETEQLFQDKGWSCATKTWDEQGIEAESWDWQGGCRKQQAGPR
jgi:hypothetical protein